MAEPPPGAVAGRFDFAEPPREYAEQHLHALVGHFPGAATAIADFLRVFDRRPGLRHLAEGTPVERDAFVLAVATLADELLDASIKRVELGLARYGAQDATGIAGRNAALDRLRAALDTERGALGAGPGERLASALAAEEVPLPVRRKRPLPPRPHRLVYALDYILGHLDLGILARRRLVATLVQEWTGTDVDATRVRLNVKRREATVRAHRPACAANPTAAIYFPTLAAQLVALHGELPPLGAHVACTRYIPLVAGSVCLPATLPCATAEAVRALLVERFRRVGLAVLPTRPARRSRRAGKRFIAV
jgi:hypothetical protein